MFARTSRLLLRPAWAEDTAMVTSMIADRTVCDALLRGQSDPVLPCLLIFERTEGAPRLVGAAGLRRRRGAVELFVRIAPEEGGRGLDTEAADALVEMARALGIERLELTHGLEQQRPVLRPQLRLAAQRRPLAA